MAVASRLAVPRCARSVSRVEASITRRVEAAATPRRSASARSATRLVEPASARPAASRRRTASRTARSSCVAAVGPRLGARGPRALRPSTSTAPQGRGAASRRRYDGAAGGAACGDLIRVSVRVEGDRVAAAGFDAAGCGALTAAGSAAVTLVDGRAAARRRARGHARDRRRARRALARASCTRPSWPPTRCTARSALAARAGAAVPRRPGPHAGRDERRRRLAPSPRCWSRAAGARRRGHARAVGRRRRTTPRRRAARRTPSGSRARSRTGWACRTSRSTCATEFRAGVVDPFLAGYAAGRDARTRAWAATATCGSTRCSSSPTASAPPTLATGHYARVHATGRAAARRRRPGQGPDLHARGAVAGDARADALPARRADQAARCARWPPRPGCRSPRKADSQDLCFLAGTGKAAFLARHGGLARRGRGRSSTAPARVLGRHRGHHGFTVGQRKGLGVAAPSRSTCCAPTRARTASSSARARSWPRARSRVRGARLLRAGDEVDRVKLRYRSQPVPCRVPASRPRAAPHAGARARRAGRRRRARPDRVPAARRRGRRLGHDRGVHGAARRRCPVLRSSCGLQAASTASVAQLVPERDRPRQPAAPAPARDLGRLAVEVAVDRRDVDGYALGAFPVAPAVVLRGTHEEARGLGRRLARGVLLARRRVEPAPSRRLIPRSPRARMAGTVTGDVDACVQSEQCVERGQPVRGRAVPHNRRDADEEDVRGDHDARVGDVAIESLAVCAGPTERRWTARPPTSSVAASPTTRSG